MWSAGGRGARGRTLGIAVRAFDRSHLLHDLIHLRGADDRLVRPEKPVALLGDRPLQVGEDLHAIGIVFQPDLRLLEVGAHRVVRGFVELVGVAVQVDGDDFLHTYRPSWLIVALMDFQ